MGRTNTQCLALELSNSLSIAFRDFHHFGAPEQPIHTYVKTVCDLAEAIKIEGAQS